MLILNVLVFLVIIFFGLIWHDESPEPPQNSPTKTLKR
jgi:hypothetical protein